MGSKRILKNVVRVLLVLSTVFLFGCSSNNTQSDSTKEKPIIAVSIVPEETFVKAVCGDLADVVTLIPPGSSPANYEPTAQQMEKLSDASLYFSIGVPTEEANILPNVGELKVISLEDAVVSVYKDRIFESGERDPHIWLSPKRAKVMVQTIAAEMSKLDPDNEKTYEDNAANFITQLDEIDQEIKDALVGVKDKAFVVYHPAFGYIADDYGLVMYALEEEGKEATAQHLKDMIDLAKEENIKVIFYQEEIDSSQSEAFAEEIGGKTKQLAPLASDYINNMKNMARTMAEAMQ